MGPGESPIGNALAGARGFDLADQEDPSSPRRMAGKQACLTATADALSIRDLDSPGGTFVNRQRLLSGQVRPLQPGDMVQLGGVQLQVKREAETYTETELKPEPRGHPQPESVSRAGPQPTAPSGPGPMSIPYTIAGVGTCRTWDDFLTLAAQRWNLVRDELTSGRLAEHLKRIQRTDLLPRPDAGMTADEQLDAWLARLPATRSSAPELDVHPQALVVRAAAGGGLIRQTLRITNVGYRLLRSSARVETSGAARVRIAPAFPAAKFQTIDQTDIPIEIELPEGTAGPSSTTSLGAVVIESNGGTRRIEVRLERPPRADLLPEASLRSGPIDLMSWGRPLGDRVASLSLARRLVLAPLALAVFRLLVLLAGLIPFLRGPSGAGGGPTARRDRDRDCGRGIPRRSVVGSPARSRWRAFSTAGGDSPAPWRASSPPPWDTPSSRASSHPWAPGRPRHRRRSPSGPCSGWLLPCSPGSCFRLPAQPRRPRPGRSLHHEPVSLPPGLAAGADGLVGHGGGIVPRSG